MSCKAYSGRLSDTAAFVAKARAAHGEQYDYSETEYVRSSTLVTIRCALHGLFQQTPNNHLRGRGCLHCRRNSHAEFEAQARALHGDTYDYSQVQYRGRVYHITIVCPEHGAFEQRAGLHLQGRGCPACSVQRQTKTLEEFVVDAQAVHGERFSYTGEYANAFTPTAIVCPDHGPFEQTPDRHLAGNGCPKCYRNISRGEDGLAEWLRTYGDIKTSCRSTLGGRQELDIVLGNLAIEYNGLYWHSEARLPRDYHIQKTRLAKEKGLVLIHVFEDEWIEKPEIVQARLLAKLGHAPKQYARKLRLAAVTWSEAKTFYTAHHLQGAGVPGASLGLYADETLVACITFGRRRGIVEVLRYASAGTVVGGFGRLFQHYVRSHPEVTEVLSYADLRWGEGKVYATQGFERIADTQLGYFWIKGQKRYTRQKFQKHKLATVLKTFDPSKSEVDNMHANGFLRVFDCGHATWKWCRK